MIRRPAVLLATAVCFAALAAPASAKWYGSTMRTAPNAQYGCESALVLGPIGGVVLAPSNQTSCTYRHGGYLFKNRPTFIVPSTGGSRASASSRAHTRPSSASPSSRARAA